MWNAIDLRRKKNVMISVADPDTEDPELFGHLDPKKNRIRAKILSEQNIDQNHSKSCLNFLTEDFFS